MNNENFELENMRQQMNTLKKKLEQQEIVNDRFIRHSMKQTAGNISRRYYMIMALCLLMLPYSYWAFVTLNGFSIPFWIFMGWFMYESYLLHPNAFFNGLFWAGCIGGIVGAIWGFSLHFKTQRQYQEIIDQIEDITADQ